MFVQWQRSSNPLSNAVFVIIPINYTVDWPPRVLPTSNYKITDQKLDLGSGFEDLSSVGLLQRIYASY